MKQSSARLTQLDGLRGIAVSLVLAYHYQRWLPDIPFIRQITAHGWVGVDLFFVLSGFLIGGIVLAQCEAPNFFSVFYLRRFLRISPLYYLLLSIVGFLVWIHWMPQPNHGSLLLNAVYLQNIAVALTHDYGLTWLQPTWSLAVEEHFYLLLPPLIALAPKRSLRTILIGGIVLATSARVLGYAIPVGYPRDFGRFFTLCRIDALFYGVLLADLVRRTPKPQTIRRWTKLSRLGLVVFSLSFVTVCHFDHAFSNEILMTTLGLALLGPLSVCVVALLLIEERGRLTRLTKLPVLRWLGIRAYAVYLLHMPALAIAQSLCGKNFDRLSMPLALAFVIAAAAASWRWLEAPLIALGHKRNYAESTGERHLGDGWKGAGKAHAA